MSQEKDNGAMERSSARRGDIQHKKILKHHRNLNDAFSHDDYEEDDFFFETKEKFHRGR